MSDQLGDTKTIRPFALKGHRSIAHETKPNGLLTRSPFGLWVENVKYVYYAKMRFYLQLTDIIQSAMLALVTTLQYYNWCLKTRKHFSCFHQLKETLVEIWQYKKCCAKNSRTASVSTASSNLNQCFHNSIETRKKFFFSFFRKQPKQNKERDWDKLSAFLLSLSINLLAFQYHVCRCLIGYATHCLLCCRWVSSGALRGC